MTGFFGSTELSDYSLTGEEQGVGRNKHTPKQLTLDGKDYLLTFNDEFSGKDAAFWWGFGKGGIWSTSFSPHLDDTRYIAANNELQFYVDHNDPNLESPFTVQNGALTITAKALSAAEQTHTEGQDYSSGLITTEMSFGAREGFIEIRADVPDEAGLWSSFWLLPADGDWSSEIDVFEIRGADADRAYTNVWDAGVPDSQSHTGIDLGDGYHTYGLMWTETTLKWYIDGQLVRETPNTVFEEMYLAISLAVGGFGGAVDPNADLSDGLSIDYVRVYELAGNPYSNTAIDPGMFESQEIWNGDNNDNTLYGSKFEDVLIGYDGADKLYGRRDDDILSGDAGNDSLYGGKGDDRLMGGEDRDHLVGGKGADVLIGGAGTDHMWGDGYSGGYGSEDSFVFESGSGKDFIHKFETDHDVLDLTSYGVDWATVEAATSDLGWAVKVDLAALGGVSGDMVYLLHTDLVDMSQDNFAWATVA